MLTAAGWIGPAIVDIVDSVVAAIRPTSGPVDERLLVPGFVDLQVNGIEDVDVSSASGADWERLDTLLLAQGVTTWCPTLVTMPLSRYDAPLARIAAAIARPPLRRPAIAGVHLEGPFLGAAPGAHRVDQIIDIDREWLRRLPADVAIVTLGAEQPDAPAAIAELVRRGVLVSIGHTRASAVEFDSAVAAGARLTTHLFNAMSGVHHREPGVATFAITNPAVSASLIADAVHVHPRVIRLAAQALGDDRLVLVTDAVAWRAGGVAGRAMAMRDGAPRLVDGTLAGSALTMDAAIRNCIAAGVEPVTALHAASRNPARLLRLFDRGVIEVGARADLVALTADHQIEQVWQSGAPVAR